MSLGRFIDFDDCVEHMIKHDRGHQEAMQICNALQRDIEKKNVENSGHTEERKKKKNKGKEMEETTYDEPCGIINYEGVELDERGKEV